MGRKLIPHAFSPHPGVKMGTGGGVKSISLGSCRHLVQAANLMALYKCGILFTTNYAYFLLALVAFCSTEYSISQYCLYSLVTLITFKKRKLFLV